MNKHFTRLLLTSLFFVFAVVLSSNAQNVQEDFSPYWSTDITFSPDPGTYGPFVYTTDGNLETVLDPNGFDVGSANIGSYFDIKRTNGAEFQFVVIDLETDLSQAPGGYTVTVTGYKSGVAVTAGIPLLITTPQDFDFSTTAGFNDVDEIKITGNLHNFFVDNWTYNLTLPTTISSLSANSGSPTNATTVYYTATFASAISGLTASNFSLNTSGPSGASIGAPTTSDGGVTWSVPVSTGSGDGTIQLELANNSSLSPGVTNSLPFNGDTYTIDKTAPTVSNLTYSSNNSTNSAFAQISNAITLSFTASEAVQTPVVTIAGHTVTANNTGGNSYSASYIMTSGDTEGRIPFSLTIKDQAGNSSSYTDVSEGDDLTFDMTPPMAAIGPPTQNNISGNGIGSITYVVTYSDLNFNTSTLTNLGINVYTTGTVAATLNVSGSGTSYNVTFSNITGSGKLSFGVKPGYATDDAGNFDSGVSPSQQVTVLGIDPTLSNLTLSNGTLTPGFSGTTTSYTAAVGNGLTSITVNPTTNDPNATVTVNGKPASTAVPLAVGTNNIAIVVTAQDGVTQQTYNLTVTEVQSYNNRLASLKTSAGLAQGATVPSTLTESVVNSVSSLTVTPTVSDPTATVTVNGIAVTSGQASGSINLNVGQNTITVVVTAQDTKQQSYTLTVTRAPSANTTLSSLVVSKGTLAPEFGTPTNYLAYVANGIQLTVTPTLTDPNATLTINGKAAASGTATAVPITVGNNTITIVVTAQNNTSAKTYTVVVNEARSPNNTLFSFKTSGGLAKGQTVPTTLAESVPYAESTITITPTTADATATVTVNSAAVTSGQSSASIPLAIGQNTITTIVTAQNQTTLTYTLTVTRAGTPSANNVFQPVGVQNFEPLAINNDGINVHQGVSPNGDGINDYLQIDNISQYPDNNLKIMTRNGQLIFEAKGYDNATRVFDGHSNKNGQMQLPGTYFYELDYTANGITKHKTGYLVLKY